MPPVRSRRVIADAGAAALLAAAQQAARELGHRVVIAVVDPWGELVELRRTPGAQIAGSRVAVDKARTAAIFVRPSREIRHRAAARRRCTSRAVPLQGGIPIVHDGHVIGAIGVSSADEDDELAVTGAAAIIKVAA